MTALQYLIVAIIFILIVILARKVSQVIDKKAEARTSELFEASLSLLEQEKSHTMTMETKSEEAPEEKAEEKDLEGTNTIGISEEEAEDIQDKLMSDEYKAPKRKRHYKTKKTTKAEQSFSEDPKSKRKPSRRSSKKDKKEE